MASTPPNETTSLLSHPETDHSSLETAERSSQLAQKPFSPSDLESDTLPETSPVGRTLTWSSAYILTISRVLGSGIFATPGVILASVGSPGLSLLLWLVGAVLAYFGLTIYLEYGCMLPRSGSEKVYLEFTYRRPKYLTSILIAVHVVLLGLTASNCVIFAQYSLFALGVEGSDGVRKGVAVGLLTAVVFVHVVFRRAGIVIQNWLGWVKIGLTLFMIFSGIFVVAFRREQREAVQSGPLPETVTWTWAGLFAGSIWSWGSIATSILKVFYSFAGLNNVNNVLNEVKDPVRTVKSVSTVSLITAGVMYALVNVAYFLVVPLDEFRKSGELISALFFEKVFGSSFGGRFLPLMVATSAAGNVMVVIFAYSRLKQEIARTGLLPFSSFLSTTRPFGSPIGGLLLHYVPTFLVLISPVEDIYSFILEVENYAGQIVALAVSFGLIWLRYKRPDIKRPYKAWIPGVLIRSAITIALLVAPLFPSEAQKAHGRFSSAVYALVGYAVVLIGAIYWLFFAKLLPKWGNYKLEDDTEILQDGTTVRKIVHVPI